MALLDRRSDDPNQCYRIEPVEIDRKKLEKEDMILGQNIKCLLKDSNTKKTKHGDNPN